MWNHFKKTKKRKVEEQYLHLEQKKKALRALGLISVSVDTSSRTTAAFMC